MKQVIGVNERPNKDRTIFKSYEHKINSNQLNDYIDNVIVCQW
jgi:hypothetical protein